MDKLVFNPTTGYNDASAFPDPASEAETRQQIQELHTQTQTFLNAMVDTLASSTGADNIGVATGETLQSAIASLKSGKVASVDVKAVQVSANNTLQVSFDGTTFVDLASNRPTVYDNTTSYPDRPKWKFVNATITYNNDYLIITAAKGDKGDSGKDGSSFSVLGHFDTLLDLQASHPTGNAGDAYQVGTTVPYKVYIWSADSASWYDSGSYLVGEKGDTGSTGPTGPAGAGVASGGTTGMLLVKKSSTDYDTEWQTVSLDIATWGKITGSVSAQTDLNNILTAMNTSIALKGDKTALTRDITSIIVPTTSFVADTTFTNYPYKADITVAGATANDVPDVQPSQDASDLGILGGKALASAGIVTIYANAVPSAAIVIDRIALRKENA